MAFKALQKKVSDLLTGSILEIPRNQRRYVWKEEHWRDLLNDLDFAIQNNAHNKKHFIGSIVLKEEEAVNGINHYTIIDGQQRTFTIVLFLSSIMQLLKERKMEDDFMGNYRLLISTDLKNQSSCIINSDYYISLSSVIKCICDWNNTVSLNDILNSHIVNKHIEKPIKNCLLFYYDELKKRSNDDIIIIRNALIETNFVEIIATTDEDSYTIFEILNARGQDLEDHELLKNYIMRYIRPQEQVKIDEVKVKWTECIDKELKNNIKKFFKHYTTHKFPTVTKDCIYKIIQKGTPSRDVNALFEDILRKVNFYKVILNPIKDGEECNCTAIEYKVFSFFKKKKSEQFRPAILSLMNQHCLGNINENKYNEALNFLFLFFICYNIIGEEKSNKLEDPIYKYSPLIENEFTESVIDQFTESLNKRLPNKDAFINIFKNIGWSNHTAFYKDSKNKERVKIVLEILEKEKSGIELPEDYTLEHILPDSEGEENALIGNIIPLEKPLNERCKNKSLVEKIPIYKESNFAIARGFAIRYENNIDNFTPQKRTQAIAESIYKFITNVN